MAIYHLSAKVISRSSGRSSVAAAAYRSGDDLTNAYDGMRHDYRRKGGISHTEILAPDNAPDWMRDRSRLWNGVEAAEKRRDAQLAREIEVSLPRELSPDQQRELLRSFVREQFVAKGMIADIAIHNAKAADGLDQPHAHVLLTLRELTGAGFGNKNRDWNGKDQLGAWREAWASYVNRALEQYGHTERIDHRTLERQREEALKQGDEARASELDREPQLKIGVAASAMERRGVSSERGDIVRLVVERNFERRNLRSQLNALGAFGAQIGRIASQLRKQISGSRRQGEREPSGKADPMRAEAASGGVEERAGSQYELAVEIDGVGAPKRYDRAGPDERDKARRRNQQTGFTAEIEQRLHVLPDRDGTVYRICADRKGERELFRDYGDALRTRIANQASVRLMLDTAQHRGWQAITLTGGREARREAWLQARERGLNVRGYEPSERDRQELSRGKEQTARSTAYIGHSASSDVTKAMSWRAGSWEMFNDPVTLDRAIEEASRQRDVRRSGLSRKTPETDGKAERASTSQQVTNAGRAVVPSPIAAREGRMTEDEIVERMTQHEQDLRREADRNRER